MVENTDGDAIDGKPSFDDYFVEIKPPKVEASVKGESPVEVEAPMEVEGFRVNSGVSNLRDNEVDITHFFHPETHEKIKINCSHGYVDKQIGFCARDLWMSNH